MAEVSPGNNAWRLERGCKDDARVKRVVYLNRPDEAYCGTTSKSEWRDCASIPTHYK